MLAGVVIICAVLLVIHGQKVVKSNQVSDGKINVAETVAAVGKLIVLPQGETPVAFEISDPTFLSGKEPFFAGAEKGDILLIYQKTGKAIIYSKARNVIVNAGPLINSK